MADGKPVVVLFGYDSSPFTQKIRLALKLRQIQYTFVIVSSMMPRPILLDSFNLTYRKIPVLAIGKEVYVDTSLIFEIIHDHPAFPPSAQHPPLHPSANAQVLTRLLSTHYTDRPLFRIATGLIPQAVWETSFGTDRAQLIGHQLNAQKLGAKIPGNLSRLDTHLSILEPLFEQRQGWLLDTENPSGVDISLYYQLDWAEKTSRGEGINNLTGGQINDGQGPGMREVFNQTRYPRLFNWFWSVRQHFESLPTVEHRIDAHDISGLQRLVDSLNQSHQSESVPLVTTTAENLNELNKRIGMQIGSRISVAPDDTGRQDPTRGTLIGLSTEEVVITPDLIAGKPPRVKNVRVHFPKIGFVVKHTGAGAKQLIEPDVQSKPNAKL